MTTETAIFGAGCFWGVEWVFRQVPGVIDAISGYAGGVTDEPHVSRGLQPRTGHAEVVQVTFDPSVVTFDQLLEVFWAMHDPTQVDRQGPDVGDQYRSAIYTHDARAADRRRSLEGARPGAVHATHRHRDPRSAGLLSGRGLSPALLREATGTSPTATCCRSP